MPTPSEIQEQLLAHLAGEVACQVVGPDDGRVGCLTPLEYPSGDNVVVWVEQHQTDFEVTDFGESLADALARPKKDQRWIEEIARAICHVQGVEYVQGRLTTRSSLDGIADAVWRVALAASQITQGSSFLRKRRRPEREFVGEVEGALRNRKLNVERKRPLKGKSGHEHKATLYLPQTETVLEPVEAHWNQAAAVYAKFGDLGQANGYRLYALLDDRSEPPPEDVAGLLTQVGSVVEWSRHDEWFHSVAG